MPSLSPELQLMSYFSPLKPVRVPSLQSVVRWMVELLHVRAPGAGAGAGGGQWSLVLSTAVLVFDCVSGELFKNQFPLRPGCEKLVS